MTTRMTVEHALAAVETSDDGLYGILLERGATEVGFYVPKGEDPQKPHDRDEVYVIVSGSGRFFLDGEERDFEAGEAIFVPAGAEHRFVDFSDDFSTWVVFFAAGPGE